MFPFYLVSNFLIHVIALVDFLFYCGCLFLEIGHTSQFTEGSEASSTDIDDVLSSYDFEECAIEVEGAVACEDVSLPSIPLSGSSRHKRCGSTSSTASGQIVCRNLCSVTDSPLAQSQKHSM